MKHFKTTEHGSGNINWPKGRFPKVKSQWERNPESCDLSLLPKAALQKLVLLLREKLAAIRADEREKCSLGAEQDLADMDAYETLMKAKLATVSDQLKTAQGRVEELEGGINFIMKEIMDGLKARWLGEAIKAAAKKADELLGKEATTNE